MATSTAAEGMEHWRLKVPSDEESDGFGPIVASPDARGLQQQLRSVRLMSAASVLLAVASVGMMASVALRATGAPVAPTSPTSVVGLSAIPEKEESADRGWYRTYLDSQVRVGEDVQSEKSDVLYAGSFVYVAEIHGRRARILKPVKGWMSVETSDGITILRPDMSYKASLNKTDIEAVFRSKEVREATARLQESALKLTAVEKKLLGTIKKMKDMPRHVSEKLQKKWPELAQHAPKVGEKLAGHAAQVLQKTMKPEGAKHLLSNAGKDGRVQHIMHSHKLDGLVKKVKSEVGDAQESQRHVQEFEESLQEASSKVAETSQQLAV